MSDRRLRELLRRISSGDTEAIEHYIRVAYRAGYSVEDIRDEVKATWVPYFAQIDKETRKRVNWAAVMHDPAARAVVGQGKGADGFPDDWFLKQLEPFMTQAEWGLYACDCIEHEMPVSGLGEANLERQIVAAREVVEVMRKVFLGEQQRSNKIVENKVSTLAKVYQTTPWLSIRRFMLAAYELQKQFPWIWKILLDLRPREEEIREAEIEWQRQRLVDYLLGLSTLPWPVDYE